MTWVSICYFHIIYHNTSLASDFSNHFCSLPFNMCNYIELLTYLILSMTIFIKIVTDGTFPWFTGENVEIIVLENLGYMGTVPARDLQHIVMH